MLYRYLDIDSEEKLSWLSDLLVNGKVFFPAAWRFNDPNEFRFQLRVPKDKTVIKSTWQRDNPQKTDKDFEDWYSTTSFTSWHMYLEPMIHDGAMKTYGMMCLSSRNNSPTMWSHYAGNHGGICIGFEDLTNESFPGILMSGNVSYQPELPVVQYFGEESRQVIYKMFFIKSTDWQYEREFRLVAEADAKLTMNPSLIREVILGMHIDKGLKDQLTKIIANRTTPIPVRKAHLSYQSYEMDID
jgi:hypothetical protein